MRALCNLAFPYQARAWVTWYLKSPSKPWYVSCFICSLVTFAYLWPHAWPKELKRGNLALSVFIQSVLTEQRALGLFKVEHHWSRDMWYKRAGHLSADKQQRGRQVRARNKTLPGTCTLVTYWPSPHFFNVLASFKVVQWLALRL